MKKNAPNLLSILLAAILMVLNLILGLRGQPLAYVTAAIAAFLLLREIYRLLKDK